MTGYVAGGYGALAAILGLYVLHLRHRARVLARALPVPTRAPDPATPVPAGEAP